MSTTTAREVLDDGANPLALEGIEYLEYATAKPQALGQVLEQMGFRPVARHRSREVLLYRQGGMNVIVNAHAGTVAAPAMPLLSAVALRVRDAAAAHARVLDLGAWDVPVQVAPMELHIPAIHGPGASRIYFVDRHREFSIYDVDFVPIPGAVTEAANAAPGLAGLHWFGVVQYIGAERMDDWLHFYRTLFGFRVLADGERFGILPRGRVLQSPDRSFYWQLIEPDPDVEADSDERLQRVAFGVPDVLSAVQWLQARGVSFVETSSLHVESRGALTQNWLGSLMFELVRHERE
ncbi:MAG: VOC family protein [Burkholderiaceae bacterium]